MGRIVGLDHVNFDTSRPDETIEFYEQVLGLVNRPDLRPAFPTPGAWLFAGDRAVVHLNFVSAEPDGENRGRDRGALNHVAFEASDFDALCAMLERRGLDYRTSIRDEIGLRQIFVIDPNGIRVELNITTAPS